MTYIPLPFGTIEDDCPPPFSIWFDVFPGGCYYLQYPGAVTQDSCTVEAAYSNQVVEEISRQNWFHLNSEGSNHKNNSRINPWDTYIKGKAKHKNE